MCQLSLHQLALRPESDTRVVVVCSCSCQEREPMDPFSDANRNVPVHARGRRIGGPRERRVPAGTAADIFFSLGMLHVGFDAARSCTARLEAERVDEAALLGLAFECTADVSPRMLSESKDELDIVRTLTCAGARITPH